MKFNQHTIEKLMYFVLVVTFGWGIYVSITLSRIGRSIDQRTQETQRQVQCIAAFFTQTDRMNLKIPSLDDCNIQRIKR